MASPAPGCSLQAERDRAHQVFERAALGITPQHRFVAKAEARFPVLG
jgi:hypothetical protein